MLDAASDEIAASELSDVPESLGPDAVISAIVLSLMSRLRVTRGAAVLVDDGILTVRTVHGRAAVSNGDLVTEISLVHAVTAASESDWLRVAGYEMSAPLRHGGRDLGFVALGPSVTGAGFGQRELSAVRSALSSGAASVRAASVAADLAASNRALGRRAQELATLLELSEAFGSAADAEAITRSLAYGLMANLLVRRVAVGLRGPDGSLAFTSYPQREEAVTLVLTPEQQEIAVPTRIHPASPLAEAGFADLLPLRAGDVTRGVVLLGPPAGGARAATDLDRPFVASLCALAVGALEATDRMRERIERESVDAELRIARTIQVGLLPRDVGAISGYDIAAHWKPNRDVSGDTYEVAPLAGGRLLVAIADVMGKGLGASLLMATLQAGLRVVRAEADAFSLDLAAATDRLNRLILDSTESHQFVTFAWAIVDPAQRLVRYVCAGHPPPRLLRVNGDVQSLEVGGPLLGVLPDVVYQEGTARIEAGDTLILYTDAITEASDAAGDEFGFDRLDAVIASAQGQSAAATAAALLGAAAAFATNEDADDETVLVIRVEEG